MVTIGGKSRKPQAPIKPQVVIQRAEGLNSFARIFNDEFGAKIEWIGDPNAASKFDSKYDAKFKTRHIEDIPATRTFRVLDNARA